MTKLNPCRFCGETKHLHVHPDYHCDNDQFTWDADLNIVRGPTGEPVYRDDDGIECLVCNASAPRTMWQADEATNRTMRARTLDVWPEYDDRGVWRGVQTSVAQRLRLFKDGCCRVERAVRHAVMDAAVRERWRSRQPMTEEEHRLMGTWPAGRLGPDRDWSVETLELTAEQIEQHGRITFVGQDTAVAIRDVLLRLEKQP